MTFSDSVPMFALQPIITDWCKRNGYEFGEGAWGRTQDQEGGLAALSFQSGVSLRRISAIIAGGYDDDTGHVSFDTADRLLCAMCRVEAWHFELKEWYGPIRIAGHEKGFEQPHVEGVAA